MAFYITYTEFEPFCIFFMCIYLFLGSSILSYTFIMHVNYVKYKKVTNNNSNIIILPLLLIFCAICCSSIRASNN